MTQTQKLSAKDKLEAGRQDGDNLILDVTGWQATFIASALQQQGIVSVIGEDHLYIKNCSRDNPVLQNAMAPDLICLDIDGCLLDVSQSFDTVVKKTVAHFVDYNVVEADILGLRARGGYNDDNVLALEIINARGGAATLDQVKKVFRDFYMGTDSTEGLYKLETPLITQETLSELKAVAPIALVTGRNGEEGPLALPLLDLPEDFPLYTVDDVKGKPAPDGILAAAKRFGASKIWMVGDNVDDIMAAKNAGAVPIGVGPNVDALLSTGATMVMPDINSIAELV